MGYSTSPVFAQGTNFVLNNCHSTVRVILSCGIIPVQSFFRSRDVWCHSFPEPSIASKPSRHLWRGNQCLPIVQALRTHGAFRTNAIRAIYYCSHQELFLCYNRSQKGLFVCHNRSQQGLSWQIGVFLTCEHSGRVVRTLKSPRGQLIFLSSVHAIRCLLRNPTGNNCV